MSKIAVQQVGSSQASVFGFKLTGIRANETRLSPAYVYDRHRKELSNFVNMLYRGGDPITYCLRTLIHPFIEKGQYGFIQTALLIRTEERSKTNIDALSQSIRLLMGGVFKNHRWDVIDNLEELDAFINPLDWGAANHVEYKRRREKIQLDNFLPERSVGFLDEKVDRGCMESESIDYVHPFTANEGAYERLFKTLLNGKQEVVWSTILSPTTLLEEEAEFLYKQLTLCEGTRLPSGEFMPLPRSRAQGLIENLVRGYLVLQDMPFYMNIILSTNQPLDKSILEYCGLALTEPIGFGSTSKDSVNLSMFNVGGYDICRPSDETQRNIISENLATLNQVDWEADPADANQQRFRHLFDANEAITGFYFPVNAEDNLPGIELFTLEEHSLPRELVALGQSRRKKILIGVNRYFGYEQNVFLSEDTRRQHTYIVGQTGTGKTTLLKTMISSDMESGNGLAVIDPHGEFYKDLLSIVPLSRKDDVVLIDPSDFQFPVAINLLEVRDDEERDFVVKELRAIFKRYIREFFEITSGEYYGPVFFQHVQNNLLLAMSDIENPGSIIEFFNIFMETNYWKRWLPLKWTNQQLTNWTDVILPNTDYNAIDRSNGGRYGDYFASKFIDFTNDTRINNIFGQPRSTVDIEKAVRENKIILINLSKGLLGEANSTLLGMILLAKITATLMARAKDISLDKKVTPFYLYVDEFQNIASENFSILLAEARKFGLGLVLANQYLSQISDNKIRNSILGNVGTMISFRLGLDDAKILESQFLPTFNGDDLCNLPNYNAVMRTNVDGERVVPTIFKTIRPSIPPNVASAEYLRQSSRQKYGTPKILAEEIVRNSLATPRSMAIDISETKMSLIENQGWEEIDLEVVKNYWLVDSRLHDESLEAIGETIQSIFSYLTRQSGLPKEKVALLWEKIKQMKSPDFYIKSGRIQDYVKVTGTEEACRVINFLKNLGKAIIKLRWLEQSARHGLTEQKRLYREMISLQEKEQFVNVFDLLKNLDIEEYSDSWLLTEDINIFDED